jgi:photosystem II stability/assembly factor-like uncharacterized protein
VDFLRAEQGFMSTDGGRLRRTADGGQSWHLVRSGIRFVALSFVSLSQGFGLTRHGDLLSTVDGGRSWSLRHAFGPSSWPFFPFGFVDGRHGWLAKGNKIYRTRDGGRRWRRLPGPCIGSRAFYVGGVSFLDPKRGFAVCGGQPATIMQAKDVYASRDAGSSWRRLSCVDLVRSACRGKLSSIGHVSGLAFRDTRIGLLLTERGGIARTVDGGRRWTQTLFTDDADSVMSTSWASMRTVYALLLHDAKLLRSDDAGRHWRQVYPRR